MRIVELLGPPGVGKTTLAREISGVRRGLPSAQNRPQGCYRAAYSVLQRHMTPRLSVRMDFTGRLLAGLEAILALPGAGPWLVEEGSAQRANVWALIAVPESTRRAYLDALPVKDMTLVWCDADVQTIVERGRRRGRPGLSAEHGLLSRAACGDIAARLAARGADLYRLDMLKPVAENASTLQRILTGPVAYCGAA